MSEKLENADLVHIMKRLNFSSLLTASHPRSMPEFEKGQKIKCHENK